MKQQLMAGGILLLVLALTTISWLSNKPAPPHYAADLKLKPLKKVEVLAPDDISQVANSRGRILFVLEVGIYEMSSPSRARQMVMELDQLIKAAKAEKPLPGMEQKVEQCNLSLAYLKQAAQIKQAQLEANDPNDSTGEVAERLREAHQSAMNFYFLTG